MKYGQIVCKNCNNTFHGNYCNQCGQDAHTGKIDRHFLVHEIQHGMFHVDKGIVFTVKELFTRPGYTIREFIDGKRIRHFKPLAFLFVLAGIYAFIDHIFDINFNVFTKDTSANNAIQSFSQWTKEHYAVAVLLQLPISAWICYLLFKKYGTNYFEQLVINTYIGGMLIIVRLVLLPVFYFFPHSTLTFILFVADQVVPPLAFYVWIYWQYYSDVHKFAIVWRAMLAYILFYLLIIVGESIVITLLANLHQ